jgi:arylsulfatase A-like enzyme
VRVQAAGDGGITVSHRDDIPTVRPSRRGRILLSSAKAPGILAGLGAAALTGIADAILVISRVPATARGPAFSFGLLFHCIAVMLPAGLVVGLLQEIVLRAGSRRESIRAACELLLGGPERWFAPNEPFARRTFIVMVWVGVALTLALQGSARVSVQTRDPGLMGLGLAATLLLSLVLGAATAVVLAWPADLVFRKVERLASPGGAALSAFLVVVLPLVWATRRFSPTLIALGELTWVLGFAFGALLLNIALLVALALSGRARSFGRLGHTTVGVTGAAAMMVGVSAATLGHDQTVLSTLLLRSVATRHLIGPLQRVVDRDGDGYGKWFGGGDCDDLNFRIHPAATEVPGNGVDENCSGSDATSARKSPTPNAVFPVKANRGTSVLFISIDAMRPDHMNVYGYERATTPNLTRFAERAVSFESAYTTSPQSIRSMSAIFTGRYSSTLSWYPDARFPQLAPANSTLAELLRAEGYATAAFLNTSYFSLTAGFFQGFELLQEGVLFKDDEKVTVSKAVAWLDERRRREEPFFTWLHLINPHAPYSDRASPEEFGNEVLDRYDEEIAAADAALGPLLDALDRLERDGQPVVAAVFSDHGEAFGEHGRHFHADALHEEILRVPLLVRAPGAPSGRLRALTSLLDLHATVLNLTGLPAQAGPSRSFASFLFAPETCRNLPACVRDSLRAEIERSQSSSAKMRALVAPPWKLIHDVEHGAWELYNLAVDRGERTNLYDALPAKASSLRARLLDARD